MIIEAAKVLNSWSYPLCKVGYKSHTRSDKPMSTKSCDGEKEGKAFPTRVMLTLGETANKD